MWKDNRQLDGYSSHFNPNCVVEGARSPWEGEGGEGDGGGEGDEDIDSNRRGDGE
ncbi:MAG: hypothetical protein SWY16_18950 [Cyanobacteriota bacterium]|nr:hypothetical protein [Cyanobacteriota bacterium]